MWVCVCGAEITNNAQNRYQHRCLCEEYKMFLARKQSIEPGSRKKYHRKSPWKDQTKMVPTSEYFTAHLHNFLPNYCLDPKIGMD